MIDNYKQPGEKSDDGGKVMSLVLIQHPAHSIDGDFNEDLIRYFKNSMAIKNIGDFIFRVNFEVVRRRLLIGTLVIGSHGHGLPNGDGYFTLGSTVINAQSENEINLLKLIAPFFIKEARVYIMACKTGNATPLLQKVSAALGGGSVHGYTKDIETTSFGPFVWLDDGTDDRGGREIVCLPGECRDITKGRNKWAIYRTL
jgi:hypothetical protein